MTKIVAIGAGSLVFGVELLRDIYQTPELRGADFWIVDRDPAAAQRMGGLAAKLNEASGWDVALRTTTERIEALPNADYVITSIAVDRDSTWEIDHKLALKHGFPSVLSENGGPGGLSHTLRSVPPMLAIAKDVERLAPNALLLNYTNPENRVCLAIHRYTKVRSIGLCHGVAETIEMVSELLDVPRDDVDLRGAGTNTSSGQRRSPSARLAAICCPCCASACRTPTRRSGASAPGSSTASASSRRRATTTSASTSATRPSSSVRRVTISALTRAIGASVRRTSTPGPPARSPSRRFCGNRRENRASATASRRSSQR